VRQIASATRLCGALDVGCLRNSLGAVVRRHDALRTRVVTIEGVPLQEVDSACACEPKLDDLSGLPADLRAAEITRLIEEQILEPIDVAVGPLFGFVSGSTCSYWSWSTWFRMGSP
jgi:hypothetical protein